MKLVIVGNGVAGTTAARYVADQDSTVDIEIFTDESYLYYPRPKLIDFLEGQVEAAAVPQYPSEWYQKRGIHVHLGQAVTAIMPQAHQIELQDGTRVAYDRLLLANGASNFIPPFTGHTLPGVLTLRTLKDALELKTRAESAEHTVILGGGLLGLDLAGAIAKGRTQVTVVEMMPRLLPRQLDEAGAQVLTNILTARGLKIIVGDQCVSVKGHETAEMVALKNGAMLPANLVAVSAGIRPNIQLAQSAGLVCNRGVVVDDFMRTSAEDIYAVGDVAEHNQCITGIIPVALAE
ncbi:MAG: NAD(P)/FAD-dependent oxidoreductase, partial [Anaerolineae bacterium]